MPAKGQFRSDLTGLRFGRLLAISRSEKRSRYAFYWLCRCDCGQEKEILSANLTQGRSTSCGCMRAAVSAAKATIHGGVGTPEYRAWSCMKTRCLNPRSTAYRHYGERGITLCERWRSYENFIADMGPRPSPEHTLERVNNNGNYTPENCRWATQGEQCRNQRRSHFLTLHSRTMNLSEWSRETGIGHTTILHRLRKGWSVEEALTRPVK